MQYFSTMTKKITEPTMKNAVIMGKKTYFGVPEKLRPLEERLNIVLTRTENAEEYPSEVVLCKSLNESLVVLNSAEYSDKIENIWIVGGSGVYKEAMESEYCHRLYITRIKAEFECDTFFPAIDANLFKLIENDADIPKGLQSENGIDYVYNIYERIY